LNQPAGEESVVARFIDNQVIGVARFDLGDVDLKALQEWIVKGVEDLRKDSKETFAAQLDVRAELQQPLEWVEKLRAAGANRMYVVVSLSDLTEDRPPFLVIPLAKGADSKAIEAIFATAGPATQPAPDAMTTAKIGDAVVVAQRPTLDRLKAAPPGDLPNLAATLDAAGKGQVRIALIPLNAARKSLESLVNDLPDEVGGGSIRIVSRGLQSASLSIGFPPSATLKLIIAGTDADAAKKLNEMVTKAVSWAGEFKEGPPEALAFTKLVAQLKPELQGNQVVIALTESQMHKLSATFAASVLNARVAALRVQVMSNLRQLDTAITLYVVDHDGKLPKDLGAELDPYLNGSVKRVWSDPLRPNQKQPYVYIRLADKQQHVTDAAKSIVLYENHTTWDNGINVAFADGHVEWITDEKQFKQMLDQTKKQNPNAVEMPQ
jgi:prepilin-type processing-associated H-X9-DG protein